MCVDEDNRNYLMEEGRLPRRRTPLWLVNESLAKPVKISPRP